MGTDRTAARTIATAEGLRAQLLALIDGLDDLVDDLADEVVRRTTEGPPDA